LPGRLVIVGDRAVIAERARMRGLAFRFRLRRPRLGPAVSLLSIATGAPVVAGRLDPPTGAT
jgi:hypothetical protein